MVSSLTFLQYFIPLIAEAHKRGIKCNYSVRPNRKDYTTPVLIVPENESRMVVIKKTIDDGPREITQIIKKNISVPNPKRHKYIKQLESKNESLNGVGKLIEQIKSKKAANRKEKIKNMKDIRGLLEQRSKLKNEVSDLDRKVSQCHDVVKVVKEEIKKSVPSMPRTIRQRVQKKYDDNLLSLWKKQRVKIQNFDQLMKKYGVNKVNSLGEYPGVLFVVDGDTYGPQPQDLADSYVRRVHHHNMKTISLIENNNFFWTYGKFNRWVDHVIFPNQHYFKNISMDLVKNVCLGNPKYDVLRFIKPGDIRKKYNLNSKNKYLVFFYPKDKFRGEHDQTYLNILNTTMNWCNSHGYQLILKNRDKSSLVLNALNGKYHHYVSDEDVYPTNSLQLLKIADMAIFFSSTTIEECIMTQTPFIGYNVDPDQDQQRSRFIFMYDQRISRYGDLELVGQSLMDTLDRLNGKKGCKTFDEIIQQKLSPLGACGRIIDFVTTLIDQRTGHPIKNAHPSKPSRPPKNQQKIMPRGSNRGSRVPGRPPVKTPVSMNKKNKKDKKKEDRDEKNTDGDKRDIVGQDGGTSQETNDVKQPTQKIKQKLSMVKRKAQNTKTKMQNVKPKTQSIKQKLHTEQKTKNAKQPTQKIKQKFHMIKKQTLAADQHTIKKHSDSMKIDSIKRKNELTANDPSGQPHSADKRMTIKKKFRGEQNIKHLPMIDKSSHAKTRRRKPLPKYKLGRK